MKSIKIHHKSHGHQEEPKVNNNTREYERLIKQSQNQSIASKLVVVLSEICLQVQQKININKHFLKEIQDFFYNSRQNINENNAFDQFKKILMSIIHELTLQKKRQENQQNFYKSQEKVIRVKSQQRIKLRLVKQNELRADDIYHNKADHYDLQKQYQKQHQIFRVQKLNKELQKKIILLSSQFRELKKQYELKIAKYKKILHSSLFNLNEELTKQFDGQFDIQYARSTTTRNRFGKDRMNGIEQRKNKQVASSTKFITIPSIAGIEGKQISRMHSHRSQALC